MTTWELTLPLPPISLKANRTMGAHWADYNRAKKIYQRDCWMAALPQIRAWKGELPTRWPVHLFCTVYVGKGMYLPDVSDVGSYVKAAIDTLVPEVFPNDDPLYIRPFTADVGRDWERPRIVLTWQEEAE